MTFIAGCKHSLDISIPAADVDAETARVVQEVQQRARLKGFRPGKAPVSIIRREFAEEIRKQVLDDLVPKRIQEQFKAENLNVIGAPDVKDVHFHDGEPLRFTVEFEVMPEIELGEYQGVEIPYRDPEVSDEDVEARINELREQKAQFVNVDPKPLADGDHAVIKVESVAGVQGEPFQMDEMTIEIGGADTLQAFTENLRGLSPDDENEFDVPYPEDYGSPRLAGKTVRFHATVKGVRRKEIPELNDDFAQDLGDYRNVEELREAVRKSLFAARQYEAQQDAKNAVIAKLVQSHDFPAPEVFVERQIRNRVERTIRGLMAAGADPNNLKLDWNKVKESQREEAVKEVKASLLLSRIAEREAITATREEVDHEVEKIARQQREPVAVVQMSLEKEGGMARIADHIQTDKTLSFLFEHAKKTAE